MDKNLHMGPREDEKFEQRDLERTKCSKNGTYKVSDPPSPSLRGDLLGSNTELLFCEQASLNVSWRVNISRHA